MSSTPKPLLAAVLLGLPSLASAQAPAGLEVTSPFQRLSEADGVVTVTFDANHHALFSVLHEEEGHTRLADLPLPGGRTVDLVLRPTSAMAADASAVVMHADGSQELVRPLVKCFTGHVDGGGAAFLGVTPTAAHGYLSLDGELYFLSTGSAPNPEHALISSASALPLGNASWCSTDLLPDDERVHRAPGTDDPSGETLGLGGGPTIRTSTLYLDCDNQYRNSFANDQAAIDYAVLLVSASSSIYRRDVGATIEIPNGYLRLWSSTPPWGVVNDFNGLDPWRSWFTSGSNPDRNVPRTLAHLLTTPVFGGVAYLNAICSGSFGFGLSSVNGSFPFPIQHQSPANWDLVVLSHELGHNFGSSHTFNYNPEIPCVDGSGPDQGTIMSYCHLEAGGINNVGIRFHPRVQSHIRNDIQSFGGCMGSIPHQRGDYDVDGDIDIDDATAAIAILGQGFESQGAEETLDYDADGDFDQVDVDLINAVVGGAPASVTMVNGTGLNSELYSAINVPLLGTTWSSQIFAFEGTITVILAYSGGTQGIFFSLGELLVDPTSNFLFSNVTVAQGFFAVHDVPVPFDTRLIGRTARVQAFSPAEAYNALDVRVNFF